MKVFRKKLFMKDMIKYPAKLMRVSEPLVNAFDGKEVFPCGWYNYGIDSKRLYYAFDGEWRCMFVEEWLEEVDDDE